MMQIQRGFTVLIIAVIVLLLGWFVVRSTAIFCWDFRNNLWGPAYLLVHNHSPYRIDTLFDLGNAVWMPMAIGLFFPLGFLPLQQASNLWLVCNLIWLLLIVWVSAGSRRPSIFLLAIALLLSFLFPPLVTHFWSGQISIFIALVFLLAAGWKEEMPLLLPAALLAAGLSKPQLAILVLPGFTVYILKKYGIQRAAQLILYLVGSILLLTVPLFLAYPNWLPDFILEIRQNPTWAQPSSLYFLRTALPETGTAIWILLVILIFGINIRLWTFLPGREAVYWSLALTLLISPYVWTWDFVLLLPLLLASLFQARSKVSTAILLGGYLVSWFVITTMKVNDRVDEPLFWWVPWLLISIVIAGRLAESRLNMMLRKPGMLG